MRTLLRTPHGQRSLADSPVTTLKSSPIVGLSSQVTSPKTIKSWFLQTLRNMTGLPKLRMDPLYVELWSSLAFMCNLPGQQVVYDKSGSISQYNSMPVLLTQGQHRRFTDLPLIKLVVAYETGFAALSLTGEVFTWGDERYASCLGRDISDER